MQNEKPARKSRAIRNRRVRFFRPLRVEALEDRRMLYTYDDTNRWTTTATEFNVPNQGDPITLTWSIVPDGTTIYPSKAGESNDNSNLRSRLNSWHGTMSTWLPYFQEVFDRWSELTGVRYVYEPNDDGFEINHPNSFLQGKLGVRGDVRIGGHSIDGASGTVLAKNYYPKCGCDPDGFGFAPGDMVIDTDEFLAGGTFAGSSSSYVNKLQNTLAHESGHGLGIQHVDPTNATKLMEPSLSTAFMGPQFDDILAAQRGYGDRYEKNAGNDTSSKATSLGLVGVGQTIGVGADAADTGSNFEVESNESDFVSIDDDSDVDYYRFSLSNVASVNITLTPQGPSYLSGPQGGTTTTFNSAAQSDLTLRVYGSDGTTLIAVSDTGGLGASESVLNFETSYSELYVRVRGGQNAAQFYQLQITGLGDPDDQISEALSLALGSTVTGTIIPGTDVDMYRFTAAAGQVLDFDLDKASGELDSYLRLFDAAGNELETNDSGAAPGETLSGDSLLRYQFNTAGTYYLGVSSWPNGPSYISGPSSLQSLTPYNAVTGAGDVDSVNLCRRCATYTAATGGYTLRMSETQPLKVTNTKDSGPGSLRQAINDANNSEGIDVIVFNIAPVDSANGNYGNRLIDVDSGLAGGDAAPDAYEIVLSSALPQLKFQTIIEGRTQTTFGGDTNPFGPEIILNGNGIAADGLKFGFSPDACSSYPASGSAAYGLNIQRFGGNAISLYRDGRDYQVAGNYIGVNATGTAAAGNGAGIGFFTEQNCIILGGPPDYSWFSSIRIGGPSLQDRNIISGNSGAGISYSTSGRGNQIVGNYIGTDRTGQVDLGNGGDGIYFGYGGTVQYPSGLISRNLISGNDHSGIFVRGGVVTIQSNLIGVSAPGTAALGNSVNGIALWGDANSGPTNIVIGTNGDGVNDESEGNVVSGNLVDGISIDGPTSTNNVIAGNFIGTNAAGDASLGNTNHGVIVLNGAKNNRIGTNSDGVGDAAERNIISGSKTYFGVVLRDAGTDNNTVAGNYIGTDVTGTLDLGNKLSGVIVVTGAKNNTIGGSTAAARNVISGNDADGVGIGDAGTDNNIVAGNYIGTNAAGNATIPNGSNGVGIYNGAKSNRIGTNGDGTADELERNIIAGTQYQGVQISGAGADNNIVAGNFIGTDVTGNVALGVGHHGVIIAAGAKGNRVGTDGNGVADVAERNVISGAILYHGVYIGDPGTDNNRVAGNYIGTNASGTAALANKIDGVVIVLGAKNNVIGTDGNGMGDAVEGNLVSGNGWDGIGIGDPGSDNNIVAGNFVGTNAAGTAAIPNANRGIVILRSAQKNIVGTNGDGISDAAERNIISGNGFEGVLIADAGTDLNRVAGNYIGTDVTGTADLGNKLSGLIIVGGAKNNVIGGSATAARNLISGNDADGVGIGDAGSDSNTVAGNYIGTNAAGTAAIGNGGRGVLLINAVKRNLIGTNGDGMNDAAERNILSGNGFEGVLVIGAGTDANRIAGNYIGTSADGTAAIGNAISGVLVHSGAAATIIGTNSDGQGDAGEGNLVSGNGNFGIGVDASNGTVIQGNVVGLNAGGNTAIGNAWWGVAAYNGSKNTLIGTNADGVRDASEGNVVSGNKQVGVGINDATTTGTKIAGNVIGLNPAGTVAIGNSYQGVYVNAPGTIVGGSVAAARNIISANGNNGVLIGATTAALVQGNYIGTDVTGSIELGNQFSGVFIDAGGTNNMTGGTAAGTGNTIAFNGGGGVVVSGGTSMGNSVRRNAIHDNGRLGIDLGADGVTANDLGDADTGSNGLLNFPVLTATAIVGNTLTVVGTLNSTPNAPHTLEFFASTAADPSGYGEGEVFVGSTTVTTDANGNASFTQAFTGDFSVRRIITATTTDAAGNTSEFSQTPNRAPTLDAIADPAAILEDALEQTINLSGITAGASESQTLMVTATSSNPGLIPDPTVNYTSANATGSLSFTPVANQSGTAVITVTVKDSGGMVNGGVDTVTRTFTVNVMPVNDVPTLDAIADPAAVLENAGTQVINLTGIAAGPSETQTLTITATSSNPGLIPNPTVNYTSANATGSLAYKPVAHQSGTAVITVTVQDDGGTANVGVDAITGTFTVSVTEVNDPPSGVNDPLSSVAEDSGARTIPFATVLSNDSKGPSNESGQTLTITQVSNLIGGTVSVSGTDVLFTPAVDYSGPASFTYALSDNGTTNGGPDFLTSTATVSFTITEVNDPPSGMNDPQSSIAEDSGARTIAFATLLSGDLKGPTSEGSQILTITTVSGAVGGTVGISGSDVIFTPAADYSGPASFVYTLQDNGTTNGVDAFLASEATVSFTITEVNDPPSGVNDPLDSIAEDSGPRTISFDALLANDSNGPNNEANQLLTIIDVAAAVGGTVSMSGTDVIFTPTADYNGPASFIYTLSDTGTTNSSPDFKTSPATVSFTITEVNDPPTGVNDPLSSVAEDSGPRTISFATLLVNDTKGPANESGQTLTIIDVLSTVGGDVNINDLDQTVIFIPADDYNGPARFVYLLEDNGTTEGFPDFLSSLATVTFNITEVNDLPSGVDDTLDDIVEDADPITIPFSALLNNDTRGPTNEAGQTLTIIAVEDPLGGTVAIDGTNIIFTPAPAFFGPAGFAYTLQDNGQTSGVDDFLSDDAVVSFQIISVNDPPSFAAFSNSSTAADEDVLTHGPALEKTELGCVKNISPGAANEANQMLTLTVTNDSHDLFAVQPHIDSQGNLTYTPQPNAHGTAIVTVVLKDDAGGDDTSVSQQFNIVITKTHRLHNASEAGKRNGRDVTGSTTNQPDGFIVAGDVLAAINYINANGSGLIAGNNKTGPPYPDVNGDDQVVAQDVLDIINYINANPGQSEAEAIAAGQHEPHTPPSDLIALLALDIAEHAVRRRRRQ